MYYVHILLKDRWSDEIKYARDTGCYLTYDTAHKKLCSMLESLTASKNLKSQKLYADGYITQSAFQNK